MYCNTMSVVVITFLTWSLRWLQGSRKRHLRQCHKLSKDEILNVIKNDDYWRWLWYFSRLWPCSLLPYCTGRRKTTLLSSQQCWNWYSSPTSERPPCGGPFSPSCRTSAFLAVAFTGPRWCFVTGSGLAVALHALHKGCRHIQVRKESDRCDRELHSADDKTRHIWWRYCFLSCSKTLWSTIIIFMPLWNVKEVTISDGDRTNNFREVWNRRFESLVGHKHLSMWRSLNHASRRCQGANFTPSSQWVSEWVSSFLTALQHNIGYIVP